VGRAILGEQAYALVGHRSAHSSIRCNSPTVVTTVSASGTLSNARRPHRAIHVMATMLPLPEALIVLNAWGGCGDPDVTPQPLAYGTGIPTCSPACGDQGGNNYYTSRTSPALAEHAAEHPCGERRSGHGAADPIRLTGGTTYGDSRNLGRTSL
jgi:hypothetical protein